MSLFRLEIAIHAVKNSIGQGCCLGAQSRCRSVHRPNHLSAFVHGKARKPLAVWPMKGRLLNGIRRLAVHANRISLATVTEAHRLRPALLGINLASLIQASRGHRQRGASRDFRAARRLGRDRPSSGLESLLWAGLAGQRPWAQCDGAEDMIYVAEHTHIHGGTPIVRSPSWTPDWYLHPRIDVARRIIAHVTAARGRSFDHRCTKLYSHGPNAQKIPSHC